MNESGWDAGREAADLSTLDRAERALLSRLLPFRGGLTLDAVDRALRSSWDYLDDPLDVVQALVRKSFLTVEEGTRYRLRPEVREALPNTAVTPEDAAQAHAGLFAWADDFCVQAAAGMTGESQERWFDRADQELENLCDAIAYGASRPELRSRALRMVTDLHRHWIVRGHFALGRDLVESALSSEDASDGLRVKATNLAGVLAMCQGDLETATQRLTESLYLAGRLGDVVAQGSALSNLGMVAWERTDYPRALDAFQRAAPLLEEAEAWGRLGVARLNVGCVLIDMERLDEAQEALTACAEPLRRGGNLAGLAYADGNLGHLAIVRGDWEGALNHVRQSLGAFGQIVDWKGTMNTLVSAAALLIVGGDFRSAAFVRGMIEKMGESSGSAPTPRDRRMIAEIDRTLAGASDRMSVDAALSKGREALPQYGAEYALAALAAVHLPARPNPEPWT